MPPLPVSEWFDLSDSSLDPSFYNIRGNELAFFRDLTGIRDDEELKAHILGVQAEAYAVYPYPCIRRFAFATLKISKHDCYDTVLKMGRERPNAILLDLGCCFGNDTRKVITDGYPPEKVIASDLKSEFWSLGHKLFRSTQESFPVAFAAGDVFNSDFIAPDTPPAPSSSTPPSPVPPLARVVSLTQLQHQIAIIHASAFFHLFLEEQQRDLAHRLGSLLSPVPGSVIFGSHVGLPDREEYKDGATQVNSRGGHLFGHSPASWNRMWAGVFKRGDVDLSTKAVEMDKKDVVEASGLPEQTAYTLFWSVTRV